MLEFTEVLWLVPEGDGSGCEEKVSKMVLLFSVGKQQLDSFRSVQSEQQAR